MTTAPDPQPDPQAENHGDPHLEAVRDRVLDAALPNVAFDGWSERTLREAAETAGVAPGEARAAFPRGAVDLALAFHNRGDRELARELAQAPLSGMKIREKVAFAVRRRLELVADRREAVRRGATLLALPIYAGEGASAIWRTADVIWTGIGDASQDANWYSKRAILSGVYASTVLYWLGDRSEGFADTWAFLDRRIDEVMRFEKTKASVKANPLGRMLMAGPQMLMRRVRAPRRGPKPFSNVR